MPEEVLSKKNYTIAIAEDNSVNMFFLKTLIEKYMPNVIILEASDGDQIINILSQIKPDLLFLDLSLPLKDGIEIITYMKKQETLKEIPIAVITAMDSESVNKRLLNMGVNLYIKKPASKDVIYNALKTIFKI